MDLSDFGLNNTFTSAIVPLGYTITVYQYSEFGGDSLQLSGNVYDLGAYGRFWDNQISSIDFR